MFAQRIRPNELIDLLAAESYDPVLMRYCEHTKHSPRLAEFVTERARLGVTGTIANAYVSEGTTAAVPYLTTKQVDGLYAHLDGCKYITSEADKEWSHCRVPDGAIVLNKSGNVGAAAIVACAPHAYVNTVSDLINIRPRHPGADGGGRAVDGGYLVVFLNSPYGQSQLQRLSGGAVFDHVSLHAVPEIRIHEPHPLAQRYIGDKVRRAERLRERAQRLFDRVLETHRRRIPAFGPSKANWSTFRIKPAEFRDVFVPHFYPPAVAEYLADKSSESLTRLSLSIYSGETYEADENGVDQTTSRSCSGRFLKRPCNRVRPPSRTDLDLAPHDLLLTNAAHDKAYIGSDVTYFHGGERNIPSAKVIVIRPDRKLIPASYVFAYLRSSVGYLQMQSAIRGISAGIRGEDIGTIRIPLPYVPDSDLDEWKATDSVMIAAGVAEEMAAGLTSAAKQLVEHLIETRVSEAELVAAHRGLEVGDRSADRRVLQALKCGDAPDAPPLIPDLDGLYALLEESDGGND